MYVLNIPTKRLAQVAKHLPFFGPEQKLYLRNRYKLLYVRKLPCAKCGSRDHLAVDHILARGLGGTHDMENLQVLCRKCHRTKTNEDMKRIRALRKAGGKT
jgi:5-methylcytosine-specific restriction endonuclease McrA